MGSLSTYQMPRRTPQKEHCMLSHDLKNCVTIILGECDLLFDLLADKPEALKRVSAISQTALRMDKDIEARPCQTRS